MMATEFPLKIEKFSLIEINNQQTLDSHIESVVNLFEELQVPPDHLHAVRAPARIDLHRSFCPTLKSNFLNNRNQAKISYVNMTGRVVANVNGITIVDKIICFPDNFKWTELKVPFLLRNSTETSTLQSLNSG